VGTGVPGPVATKVSKFFTIFRLALELHGIYSFELFFPPKQGHEFDLSTAELKKNQLACSVYYSTNS
jgi:hypothetical protein